jgi:hypothetical protein
MSKAKNSKVKPLRLCKTCKHSSRDKKFSFDESTVGEYFCLRDMKIARTNPVTGDESYSGVRECEHERGERTHSVVWSQLGARCSEKGRFWKPKPKPRPAMDVDGDYEDVSW